MPMPVSATVIDSPASPSNRPEILIRPPGGSELHRIADQVEENLPRLTLIGAQPRQIGGEIDRDGHPRLVDRRTADPHHRLDDVAQIENLFLNFELAGFGLGDVEDLVDQVQQMRAARNEYRRRRAVMRVVDRPITLLFMISVKPMIAFNGVRSSWLIVPRNSDFARLAASASSPGLTQRRLVARPAR